MKHIRKTVIFQVFILLTAIILALPCSGVQAESVYKCMKDGKVRYMANPSSADGQCQETRIDQQNPEDFARAWEEKKIRQEAERKANEEQRKEREVRAKELEAAAAARRAYALEQQLLLQRQQSQQQIVPQVVYPYYYPYWGGGGIRPIQPFPPNGGGSRPPHQHQHQGMDASRPMSPQGTVPNQPPMPGRGFQR